MKNISTLLFTAVATATSVLALATLAKGDPISQNSTELIERGHYLVHQVGMCTDCHSPRNEKGELIESKQLTGAPLAFAPIVAMPWIQAAPRIAGLPRDFTSADTVHFLMTGERPNGRPAPLPPMPSYRFNRADAEAITAYLKSLPASNP